MRKSTGPSPSWPRPETSSAASSTACFAAIYVADASMRVEAGLMAMALPQAFCVVGMGLVPLPVGDERGEPAHDSCGVRHGRSVSIGRDRAGNRSSGDRAGMLPAALCPPDALPASASSSNCHRSLEVSAQRLGGQAALEFAPASKETTGTTTSLDVVRFAKSKPDHFTYDRDMGRIR
jgi:hypothetical protein